ncbi:hypothetical protein NPIL_405471 [Nephila pilipes]|uniref:Uncharacterized protein n=1 Tax=Nephila pilipes TaxID=299642 RepID=A0A8X6PEV4_NEPPI|nr:hypothetical protein NPIL_405471 [Nephila pilipes]
MTFLVPFQLMLKEKRKKELLVVDSEAFFLAKEDQTSQQDLRAMVSNGGGTVHQRALKKSKEAMRTTALSLDNTITAAMFPPPHREWGSVDFELQTIAFFRALII